MSGAARDHEPVIAMIVGGAAVPRRVPGGAVAAVPRNAGLAYRPVGRKGERYPAWIRDLKGQSGVYVIRVREDGKPRVVYVGESHSGRLYETMTRHFQVVRHEAQEVPMT